MNDKKALLVGLNDYPENADDLSSCLEDIKAWRSILLEKFAFPKRNICLLANQQATKKNVVSGLRWLTSNVKTSDVSVFVYSGHGTTFEEREGVGRPDEAKDEGLVLYDSVRWHEMLVDDDLSEVFRHVPAGVDLTVVCDACFSGGMDTKSIIEPLNIKYAHIKYRQETGHVNDIHRADVPSSVRVFGCGLSKDDTCLREGTPMQDFAKSKSLLLAACGEKQVAATARSDTEGLSVFSYYAIRTLRTSCQPLTARELITRTKRSIANAGHSQTPQLKGRADLFDKPMFG